ncbi:MAG TPA: hypothetical protein VMA32_01235 [Streptosporangiaceae bacterium]|nr:hypothetical protein [Streptosporangiaceae bacterium]
MAWLIAAALAFTLAVLLFTPLRMGLSLDEAVYASQISKHVPPMPWGPHRARGLPLLVAPVMLLTDSAFVLRLYLTILAGIGMFLALLAWRGLKPAWVLALAALMFGGLGMVQSQASQLFPNYWIALGGLAAVGLFLQVWTRTDPPRRLYVLLAVAIGFTTLMRPPDSVVLAVPLLVVAAASLTHRPSARRSGALLLAVLAGLAIGCGEWLIEAYMYFQGPAARLSGTAKAVGGTKFDPLQSLRVIDGGATAYFTGWSHPRLLLWWFIFALLALLGIYVTRLTRGWVFAAMPALCALAVYALYTLPIRDNARYLLPAWALLALPAADGIAWLAGRPTARVRFASVALVVVFLAVELGTQHAVLDRQTAQVEADARADLNTVNSLRALGINGHCYLTSVGHPYGALPTGPAAYYLSCGYTRNLQNPHKAGHRRLIVLVRSPGQPWGYARAWPSYKLNGTGNMVAYVQPPR